MSAAWQGRALRRPHHPEPPRRGAPAVEVLLCDSRGQSLRLLADGFTVDDAIATAERDAARRFHSDYAYTDWRAR